MNKQLKSKANDEWQTLPYAIKPLLKYLKPKSIIWCPFDKTDSEYVRVLKEAGHAVFYSHIDDRIDFFKVKVEYYFTKNVDYIISNPPYSIRRQVFEHLEKLRISYAMLVPVTTIALKYIKDLSDKEILVFNKRIKYKNKRGVIGKNPTQETMYLCKGVLPKQMIKEVLIND